MPEKQETLEETLDRAFGIKRMAEDTKKEIDKMTEKVLEPFGIKGKVDAFNKLHPPGNFASGPPYPPSEAMSSEYVPLTMNIDFVALASTLEFQRFIAFLAKKIMPGAFKGVSTRANKKDITRQFNQAQIDYTLVMNEMKQVLKLRRVVANGN